VCGSISRFEKIHISLGAFVGTIGVNPHLSKKSLSWSWKRRWCYN